MQYSLLFNNFDKNNQDSNRENSFLFNIMKKSSKGVQSKMFENRQRKLCRRVKRFIIELNDFQNEILLTDIIKNDANFVYAIINLFENFVNNVIKSPKK